MTGDYIDKEGIYAIPDDVYHADPVPGGSLSSTGARKLLPPSCPALFRYEQLHRAKPRRVFDFGHAAHKLVLGEGPELVVVDADDWRTKAAQEQRKAAYAEHKVPLLPHDHEQVVAMADALRAHPVASALFSPDHGNPERSLFWRDQRTGIWRRARLDWLPEPRDGRLIAGDYKTTTDASPAAIQRTIHEHGYHQQADWYLDGLRALGLADKSAAFLFVFQEKTPPFLVTVIEIDVLAMRIARDLNRQAIDLYRACRESGRWPGYSDEIELVSLPAWVENRYLQETA